MKQIFVIPFAVSGIFYEIGNFFYEIGFEIPPPTSEKGFPNFTNAKYPPATTPRTIIVIPTASPAAIPASTGVFGLKQYWPLFGSNFIQKTFLIIKIRNYSQFIAQPDLGRPHS